MKSALVAMGLALAAFTTHADNVEIIAVDQNNSNYWIQKNTFKVYSLVVAAKGGMLTPSGTTFELVYVVEKESCVRGWGNLRISQDVPRKEVDSNFRRNGPTTTDAIATKLCLLYR
jgi:hypothetical protein